MQTLNTFSVMTVIYFDSIKLMIRVSAVAKLPPDRLYLNKLGLLTAVSQKDYKLDCAHSISLR